MDSYYARFISAIISIFLILSASTVVLIHKNKCSNGYHRMIDNGLLKQIGSKTTVNDVTSPKLGEIVYRNSDLYKYNRKFRRELELAKTERKKECGTFVKFSAIDCDICILFVTGLNVLIEKGSTQEDVVEFTTKVCIDLKIEDERVCESITREFKVGVHISMVKKKKLG